MTPEQDAAAPKLRRQALRVGDCHRPMLRELSRGFYIRSHAQEISQATVTPATASARAGRISHDPSQDPIARATTAGARDWPPAAGPLSWPRATTSPPGRNGARPP